ncbi:MAG: polymer-forming cytoskeletal protein [Gemmatimonadota bacterium]|nr:polymer-forming cytoskeletal protein [Gemmatimonadota bacterium]MDH5804317.1 polymer-forming cytoskeletal protein [Gemmatimonadota bacterium]
MSGNDKNKGNVDRGVREPGLSVIAAGMKVIGEISTNGVIKVEGYISGSVRAERQVLVAKGGVVEGDIFTREVVLGGEVRGSVMADERVEVQSTSVVHGDITTQKILVQEGGEVNGLLKMEDPKALSGQKQAGNQENAAPQGNKQPEKR